MANVKKTDTKAPAKATTKAKVKEVVQQIKTFAQTVYDNVKLNLNPFPVVTVGALKLKRSQIPKEKAVREVFILDYESDALLAQKAIQLGVTTDELLRQAVWSLIS